MPSIDVRPAEEADLVRLVGWWRDLIQLHAEREPAPFQLAAEAEATFTEYLRRQAGGPDSLVLVARLDEVPAGFANLEIRRPPPVLSQRRFGYLDNLYVAPGCRRSGVAAALLLRARRWLAERGVGAWSATVYAWNAPALALCARFGLAPRTIGLGGGAGADREEATPARPLAPVRHVLTVLAFDDLSRAVAFYRSAFGWAEGVGTPDYVELVLPGGMRLGLYQREAFARNTGQAPTPASPGALSTAELYLVPDDLGAAVAALEAAGARCLSPAARRDWGDEVAYYADPEGHVLALARPLAR